MSGVAKLSIFILKEVGIQSRKEDRLTRDSVGGTLLAFMVHDLKYG